MQKRHKLELDALHHSAVLPSLKETLRRRYLNRYRRELKSRTKSQSSTDSDADTTISPTGTDSEIDSNPVADVPTTDPTAITSINSIKSSISSMKTTSSTPECNYSESTPVTDTAVSAQTSRPLYGTTAHNFAAAMKRISTR
jgi:hypothetical protein